MEGAAAFSLAKTSVWWDIENCRPPADVNPYDIAKNISNCLHSFNFVGPLTISAYGDTYQLTRHVQNALTSTGIALNHIPSGRKEASDKAILMNMAFWTNDNPPPANVLLITGDQDFSPLLHRLQMKRFNVLLARPEGVHVSDSLLNSANTVWFWSRLARAEIPCLAFPRDSRNRAPGDQLINNNNNSNTFYQRPAFRSSAPPPQAFPLDEMLYSMNPAAQPQQFFRHQAPALAPVPAPVLAPVQVPAPRVQQTAPEFSQAPRAPAPRFPEFSQAARRPFFLQWPASPKCFSGVGESGVKQPQVGDMREYYEGRPVVRKALETLNREMMLPTESNIYNCIVFGQKYSLNFNLYMALEQGVKAGELVVKKAGAGGGEKIYLPAGLELWPYVDPNICQEYDADIWNDFRNFLCGEEVHAFVNSANHYHAALVLRGIGLGRLSDLALAQIYNVIQLAILVRLWIKPHRNWSPLTITISRSTLAGSSCTAALEEKAVDVVHQSSPAPAPAPAPFVDHFEKTTFEVVNKVLEEPSLELLKTNNNSNVREVEQVQAKVGISSKPEAIAEKVIVREVTKTKKEKPAFVLRELKSWLPSMLSPDGYDISLVRQDFKSARGINLDHQALGYPRLVDIMKKFPDVVQISSPRPGLCKLYPPGTRVVQEKKEKPSPAETLERLRVWLPEFISKRAVCDLATFCKEFERECKMKLVATSLGFPSVSKLLEQFPEVLRLETLQSGDLVLVSAKKSPAPPPEAQAEAEAEAEAGEEVVVPEPESPPGEADPAEVTTGECLALLLESIPRCKAGYPVARLKEDFQLRYGYSLDHSGLGYKKLESFVERMRERVEVKTGPGGHKLLFLREFAGCGVLSSDSAPEESSAPSKSNPKKNKKAEAVKQQVLVPVHLRYAYVEKVAESRFPIKLSNPLCMVD